MKICPKCHSSYTDETLNFCLTDGVPLVVEEVFQDRLSSQNTWQEAETLHDSRFIAAVGQHTTAPNNSAPTFTSTSSQTNSFSTEAPKKSSRAVLFSVVGIVLALGVVFGIFWRSAGTDNAANNSQKAVPTATVIVKRSSVSLTVEQQNQVKNEIAAVLEDWRSSIEKREIERHIANYMQTLEDYYKESGIDKNHVRADRQRAFDRYDSINLQLDNLEILPESMESATAVFDKSWTFKNAQKTSTGSVQQEMHLIKMNGRWLIIGEKDLKVYYINNRENQAANSSANQTANSSNSANSANSE